MHKSSRQEFYMAASSEPQKFKGELQSNYIFFISP